MKNPRFAENAVETLRFPKKSDVICKDCIYAAEDIKHNDDTIDGATLGTCDAFSIKPPSVLLSGGNCPYYRNEEE